jgi:hydrogenase nickel incorporation protein HypB
MEIEILRNVLERNDAQAEQTREMLGDAGVVCFNLIGSAGSGKTTLLETMLPTLGQTSRVAVLEGDIATTRDAERIAAVGVKAMQLTTDGGCHLSAALVHAAVNRLDLDALDAVFVENVGNLVCPASFDIGEHFRIAVLSFAEGDDKPAKYPLIFKTSDLIVLSKSDFATVCDFDPGRATEFIRAVNPDAPIMVVSSRTGDGMNELSEWFGTRIENPAKA